MRTTGMSHGEASHPEAGDPTVLPPGAAGQISISVSEAGNNLGNAYTGHEFGGVRAEIVRTAAGPRQNLTTF